MDSRHFLIWIDRTASFLGEELGNIISTEDTIPPKRAWQKDIVMEWLVNHNIGVSFKATKAELLVLAIDNLPPKRYVIDEAAKTMQCRYFTVDRIPPNYFLHS
jgi:hypothetical protein